MKFCLSLALVLGAAPCMAETVAGVVYLQDTSLQERPLSLSIWYPSEEPASAEIGGNPVFEGVPAAPGSEFPDEPLPLVVVSHGGLRSASDSGAWLSSSIARTGKVVVEVNAPRPDNAAVALEEIWRRPQDIGRAIDRVTGDETWGSRVEENDVTVIGIALGATAALSVGGAELDTARYLRSCKENTAPEGPDCGWYAAQGVDLSQSSPEGFEGLAQDPRVASVVALNPEYATALSATSAEVDTLRISLGNADDASAGDQTSHVVAIPDASVFDAFAVCTAAGPDILIEEAGDASLCEGSAGERRTVHREVRDAILSFLEDVAE